MIEIMHGEQQMLRVIRFFLPKLSREHLSVEIEAEKAMRRDASARRVQDIRTDGGRRLEEEQRREAGIRAQTASQIDELRKSAVEQEERLADERRDVEARSSQRTAAIRSDEQDKIAEAERGHSTAVETIRDRRNTAAVGIVVIALLLTGILASILLLPVPSSIHGLIASTVLLAFVPSGYKIVRRSLKRFSIGKNPGTEAIIIVLVILILCMALIAGLGLHFWLMGALGLAGFLVFGIIVAQASNKISSERALLHAKVDEIKAATLTLLDQETKTLGPQVEDIERRKRELASHTESQVAALQRELQAKLEALATALEAIRRETEHKITAEEVSFQDEIRTLSVKLDDLVQVYESSVATEGEVMAFAGTRFDDLRRQVCPALGLQEEDVLDNRCAEVWAPTFLQIEELPGPVREDIEKSERDVLALRDTLIGPMRAILADDSQWAAFRQRVLPLLGLGDHAGTAESPNGPSPRLTALTAVRFSNEHQCYLAGHYFYQRIVCAGDFVGLFRAYVNVLNSRIPYTHALQILYTGVAAIGIETAFNIERYEAAGMTINQHTHTLALEITSGSTYKMSGDAGSSGHIESVGDASTGELLSKANEAFRDQIVNVRALIRDVKTGKGSCE
jgi:hypothetical protein